MQHEILSQTWDVGIIDEATSPATRTRSARR
jgi:hypothetical protein